MDGLAEAFMSLALMICDVRTPWQVQVSYASRTACVCVTHGAGVMHTKHYCVSVVGRQNSEIPAHQDASPN